MFMIHNSDKKPLPTTENKHNKNQTQNTKIRWKSMIWTTKLQRTYFQVIVAVTRCIPHSQLPFPCKLRDKLIFSCDLQLTHPGHKWFQLHLYWPLSDSNESIHGILFLLCFTLFCVCDVTVNFYSLKSKCFSHSAIFNCVEWGWTHGYKTYRRSRRQTFL